jgi:hypothetical protein
MAPPSLGQLFKHGREGIFSVMREVARLLSDMLSAGVITEYAVFGAVAQMRYTEAVSTMDADILVAIPGVSSLDLLRPIYEYCTSRGFPVEGESIRIGAWPVQFIPAFSPLTEEAMHEAAVAEIEGEKIRVVRADHLAVIALSVGRPKDHVRILSLLEAGSVDAEEVGKLAARHGLTAQWRRFQSRFLEQ